MIIKQLSVFLENKQGRICAAADLLAQNNINIRALSLADTSEFGILRLIVDKPEEGKKILTEAGLVVRVTDVLSLTMDDTPGGTLGVLRLLSESGIGVEYMYAFAGKSGAVMIIQAEDLEAAEGILQRGGFRQAEIEGI
ncbi:MAG: amino acid-binding protein [Clostridia bacterium]|nr:amino acid-binding protein [Clostridia bacterium]